MQAEGRASLTDADARPRRRPRRSVTVLLAVAVAVWALDQVTKVLAVRGLDGRAPVAVVGELLQLRLVHNPGAAFGLAGGATVVFSLVAVVVVLVVLRVSRRLGSTGWALALGLLLGGALGNLTDRLLREPGPLRGRVVDFLELPNWPVFNVADMAIVSASALMLLLSARGVALEGGRYPGGGAEAADTGPGGSRAAGEDGAGRG